MPSALEFAYVGIGANLGDAETTVRETIRALARLGRMRASSLYRTEPQGDPRQPWYVNAVVELATALEPRELFARLQALERAAGRPARRPGNAPRTLDLDLLLHGARLVEEPDLVVPHPRYRQRRFVLVPLLEVAPQLVDPRDGVPLARVLADLDDPLRIERI